MAKQTSNNRPAVEAESTPEKRVRPVYANKLTVTLANGQQRVYTPFTHGKVWEALAQNYHEANEGSTIE